MIQGYSLLLNGPAGAGKTTYALQFLKDGLQSGEKAIFVTFDIPSDGVLETARSLGFGFEFGMSDLMILDYFSSKPATLNDISIALHKLVEDCCKKGKIRIVVDSLSTLALLFTHDSIAPWVLQQRTRLRRLPAITLFCYDAGIHPPTLYLALKNVLDGTLELRVTERLDGDFERHFRVLHLRGRPHSSQWSEYEIMPQHGIRFLQDNAE